MTLLGLAISASLAATLVDSFALPWGERVESFAKRSGLQNELTVRHGATTIRLPSVELAKGLAVSREAVVRDGRIAFMTGKIICTQLRSKRREIADCSVALSLLRDLLGASNSSPPCPERWELGPSEVLVVEPHTGVLYIGPVTRCGTESIISDLLRHCPAGRLSTADNDGGR